jgi:hypothetical protein
MKNHIAYFLLAFMFFSHANAQLPLNGTKYRMLYMFDKDVNTYANSYLAPLFKGFGYGFNSGWYSTAKTHKLLGVDISLGFNFAFVPSRDESFKLRNSDYNNLRLIAGTEAKTPTLFGSKNDGPQIQIYDNVPAYGDAVLAQIKAPEGIGLSKEVGFSAVPLPVLQLGIGLIKNTDIKIRYVPDLLEDQDYSYWGLGLMHDITQWIPVVDKLPIDISVFGSYSSLTFTAPLTPDDTGFPGSGQMVKAKIKGYTVEALISKKIAVLTVLGGIGYISGKTSFDLRGKYDITYPNAPTDLPFNPDITLQNPIGIKTTEGGLKLTGGIQLQFAVFKLFANYSVMHYNVLNAGIGLTFR